MNSHQRAANFTRNHPFARFDLRPLHPSDVYWNALHVEAGILSLSVSAWAHLVNFMFRRKLANNTQIPFDRLDNHAELLLIAMLQDKRDESVHTFYTTPAPLNPDGLTSKIHLTHGFCKSICKALDSGAIARFNKILAAELLPRRLALEESGGLVGTLIEQDIPAHA